MKKYINFDVFVDGNGGDSETVVRSIRINRKLDKRISSLAKNQNRNFSNTVETILLSRIIDNESLIEMLEDSPDLEMGGYWKSDGSLNTKEFLESYNKWIKERRELLEDLLPVIL